MKKIKIMISVLLLICLTVCFTGCDARCGSKSDLKDNIVEGWNNWMQSFSEYVLTKENDLKGEKSRGDDAYTAVYDEFNGKELIFGGTALERENGNCLKVTYCLTVEEGNAALYWISGSDKYMIASDSSEDSGEYTISPGDNYYVFEGENFTGKLELTIEDAQN